MANDAQLNLKVKIANAEAAFGALRKAFQNIRFDNELSRQIEAGLKDVEKKMKAISAKGIDLETASPEEAREYYKAVKEVEDAQKNVNNLIRQQTEEYLKQRGTTADIVKDINQKVQAQQREVANLDQQLRTAERLRDVAAEEAKSAERNIASKEGVVRSQQKILSNEKETQERRDNAVKVIANANKQLEDSYAKVKKREEAEKRVKDIIEKRRVAEVELAFQEGRREDIEEQAQAYEQVEASVQNLIEANKQNTQHARENKDVVVQGAQDKEQNLDKVSKTVEHLTGKMRKLVEFTIAAFALRQLRRFVQEGLRFVAELDKSLTEIATVTGRSRKEMWGMAEEFNRMGRELGKTTNEITRASVLFYRQGLETNQVLEMVRASTISAAIANTNAEEASNRLTAALRGYNMAASDAMAISDKLAALAARSASSFDELSYAMTKTAASAAVAGIDIDHLYALAA